MIAVGKIIRFQGKKGEVRLKFYPGGEKLLVPGERIYVGPENRALPYRVESMRRQRDFFVVKLEKIDSLEAALSLRSQEIFVEEERLPELRNGEYYEHQIKGFPVRTKENKEVGRVVGFWEVKGKTLMVVNNRGREILVPFEAAICYEVDLKQRIIRIDPPEGLLDLNEI
ncbi:MAG: ribosome maturation factor RimM [Candidatus Aminicenantales bacterium]